MVGFKNPSMSRSTVDLPEPLGPSNPTISPGAIRRFIAASAECAVILGQVLGDE